MLSLGHSQMRSYSVVKVLWFAQKKIDLKVKGQAPYSLMMGVVSVFIVSSGLNIHFLPVFYVIM